MFEEKRGAPRVRFIAPAQIKVPGDDSPRPAAVADISRTGLGLQTDHAIDPGKFTTIHVMLKNDLENIVDWRTTGTVVRSTETDRGYVIGVSLTRPINRINAPELHSTLEQAGA